jgi:hypothetical protein
MDSRFVIYVYSGRLLCMNNPNGKSRPSLAETQTSTKCGQKSNNEDVCSFYLYVVDIALLNTIAPEKESLLFVNNRACAASN